MSFHLMQGHLPLLLSLPHLGTHIPESLRPRFQARALAVEDTDWHLDRLYDFAQGLGASVLKAQVSRYVIDLNRPPDDQPMYPGASNTELCPTRFFSGEPLYVPGQAPDASERLERREAYWRPYHQALARELERLRTRHGYALLWDGHSIRAEIPWLFEGRLPDLNVGTAAGASADARVADAVMAACQGAPGMSAVLNGRFKGGYITRHYGCPAERIHAVQLEMGQHLYMQDHAPFAWLESAAVGIRPVVRAMLEAALSAVSGLYETGSTKAPAGVDPQ